MSWNERASMTEPGPWGVRWRPLPRPRLRVFCVPHSGGGASAYRPWAGALGDDVEVVAVRMPGRESRFREPPLSRLCDVVPALVRDVEPLLDVPHAWFGHSMGALIAFEACREVRRRRLDPPVRLLVAGRAAPQLPSRDPRTHEASDEEFTAMLGELNGTPFEVRGDGAFAGFLPTLRADFSVIETYEYGSEPPLEHPITVYGGTEDPVVEVEELYPWDAQTTSDCAVRLLPGDHFFLHQDRDKFVAALAEDLSA